MTAARAPSPGHPRSLEAQIREAERQVSSRQRRVAVCAATLNLLGSARALYTGLLPIAWMVKSLHRPPAPEPGSQAATASGEAQDGRNPCGNEVPA
jgi:hypothetical protein